MAALNRILVFPWNERYAEAHADYIGAAVIDVVQELVRKD